MKIDVTFCHTLIARDSQDLIFYCHLLQLSVWIMNGAQAEAEMDPNVHVCEDCRAIFERCLFADFLREPSAIFSCYHARKRYRFLDLRLIIR